MGVLRVCFHGKRQCGYCPVAPRPKIVRRHCRACGRFLAVDHRGATCSVCQGRFVPMRLPLAG